mmetsp:Transcript_34283/g.63939  ORF Transcript_34283/g.63939 Transcript_34283/m.63939 type:complete len:101 (-) Transcript_34283:57-359(-)
MLHAVLTICLEHMIFSMILLGIYFNGVTHYSHNNFNSKDFQHYFQLSRILNSPHPVAIFTANSLLTSFPQPAMSRLKLAYQGSIAMMAWRKVFSTDPGNR